MDKTIDLVNLRGKKIVFMRKMGGFRNGNQQNLNEMVGMVKF